MKLLKNENVIVIMKNALDSVDPRLMDHGKRVAWMMFRMLKRQNKHDDKQLRDICILAMLHDIGAYKTEEINKMVIFETIDIWEHSVYGYLFLKHFSPLGKLAPAILFHHADCGELSYLSPAHQELAQMISLCDRADISLHHSKSVDAFYRYIEKNRDIKFRSDVIDLFVASDMPLDTINEEIYTDKEFLRILYETPLTEKEVSDYIKMIIFSIDFRSRQTFTHTIAAACVARTLAKLSGAGESDMDKVTAAAMLHDIGKTGIPVSILESPNRLNDAEMEIMRTHVDMTEKIITGSVDEEIMRIAIRHHEKLNGTGYPRGLSREELSFYERLLAIADIFSALYGVRSYKDTYQKEKIVDILNGMSGKGLLDAEIVALALQAFDSIVEELNHELKPVTDAYNIVNDEYLQIKDKVKNSRFEDISIY